MTPSGPCTGCARTSTSVGRRLPLRYFDTHPRGDLLSRVTNDIDNIATTMQQTMTQAITSDHDGARGARDDDVDQPDPGAGVAADRAAVVLRHADDRQALAGQFVGQWKWTGEVNAHRGDVHRPRTGQGLRPPDRGDRGVRRANEKMYAASFRPSSSPGSSSRR